MAVGSPPPERRPTAMTRTEAAERVPAYYTNNQSPLYGQDDRQDQVRISVHLRTTRLRVSYHGLILSL